MSSRNYRNMLWRVCHRPYVHCTHAAKMSECLRTFNHPMQPHQPKNIEGKWSEKNVTAAHNILYSHNLFPHNVCTHFIGFDILQAHACNVLHPDGGEEGRVGGGKQKKNVRRNVRIFDFHHRYFILSEWLLLAHYYIWIWYRVCVSFSCFLRSLCWGRVDERERVEKTRYSWDGKTMARWCGTVEKFLTIMMSISWKVRDKSFHLIFFTLVRLLSFNGVGLCAFFVVSFGLSLHRLAVIFEQLSI